MDKVEYFCVCFAEAIGNGGRNLVIWDVRLERSPRTHYAVNFSVEIRAPYTSYHHRSQTRNCNKWARGRQLRHTPTLLILQLESSRILIFNRKWLQSQKKTSNCRRMFIAYDKFLSLILIFVFYIVMASFHFLETYRQILVLVV